jgi:hypothetical protein
VGLDVLDLLVERIVAIEQGLEVMVGGLELADELAVFREHGRPFCVSGMTRPEIRRASVRDRSHPA